MDRFVESGQAFTLVPARARRIDERIARLLGEAPTAFGFHSNTDGVRQSSVFYKSEFV
ncbi:hypothetical protein [Streptomyces sp. S1A1-7]|uniref:hypothetical protein n=1 Tax=Streptomyces sp. S1A1-7 TaxID=2594459 RepID=UPI0013E03533|nr:hypothetical protein [Streptomyces sp. S1A1-7]